MVGTILKTLVMCFSFKDHPKNMVVQNLPASKFMHNLIHLHTNCKESLILRLHCWFRGWVIISLASNMVFWTFFYCAVCCIVCVAALYKYGAIKCPKSHVRFDLRWLDFNRSVNRKIETFEGASVEPLSRWLPYKYVIVPELRHNRKTIIPFLYMLSLHGQFYNINNTYFCQWRWFS